MEAEKEKAREWERKSTSVHD